MRVNHVLLLASMSKRGWSQSASCRLCQNRVEDVDHVLFDCPALEDCRSPGGARTEARSSGQSDPCSWKRRSWLGSFCEGQTSNAARCARAARPVRLLRSSPWPGDLPAQDEQLSPKWPRALAAQHSGHPKRRHRILSECFQQRANE